MEAIVLFALALGLALLGVPIAAALGGAAVFVIWWFGLAPLEVVPNIAYATVSRYTLLAVPFFIVAGFVMERSGIAERLVSLATVMVGRLPGGLAYVTIVVAICFAGISGSGTADTAALSAIMIPSMLRTGYSREFSAALVACGGSIGVIMPPSIGYILYGATSGASIGKLFIAGIVPGILVATGLGIVSYFAVRKLPALSTTKVTVPIFFRAGREAIWGLAAPIIILGGIYSGVFTPTEAAGIVVIYSLIVGTLIYRKLGLTTLPSFFVEAAQVTSMAMVIVVGASLFSWVITRIGVSQEVVSAVTSVAHTPFTVVVILALVLLVAGMFLDAVSITFVFIPLFLPILTLENIDLVWFGTLFAVLMAIGQVHPPIGVNFYISTGLAKARFSGAVVAVLPMVAAQAAVVVLLLFFPVLSLWLPTRLGMH